MKILNNINLFVTNVASDFNTSQVSRHNALEVGQSAVLIAKIISKLGQEGPPPSTIVCLVYKYIPHIT